MTKSMTTLTTIMLLPYIEKHSYWGDKHYNSDNHKVAMMTSCWNKNFDNMFLLVRKNLHQWNFTWFLSGHGAHQYHLIRCRTECSQVYTLHVCPYLDLTFMGRILLVAGKRRNNTVVFPASTRCGTVGRFKNASFWGFKNVSFWGTEALNWPTAFLLVIWGWIL